MSESTTAEATEQTEQTTQTAETQTEDVSGLKSALEKERSTARDASKALKAAQAKIAEFENRDKSDTERLTAERDKLKLDAETALTKLRTANARSAVIDAVSKLNPTISPVSVFNLVRDGLEYDDDGEPTNVAAALKTLGTQDPGVFRKSGGKGDGGETGAGGAREYASPTDRMASAYDQISKAKR